MANGQLLPFRTNEAEVTTGRIPAQVKYVERVPAGVPRCLRDGPAKDDPVFSFDLPVFLPLVPDFAGSAQVVGVQVLAWGYEIRGESAFGTVYLVERVSYRVVVGACVYSGRVVCSCDDRTPSPRLLLADVLGFHSSWSQGL